MNDAVIKQMEKIVAEVMTSYQSDFENYDRRYIEKAETRHFPMIWIVGEAHTHLPRLGGYKDLFFNNEFARLGYVQGDNGFDCYLNIINSGDHIFIIEQNGIREISLDQAEEAIRDYTIPVVKEWEDLNGPLPKRCKVEVKLSNISISKLKELIRDCQEHGDTSLIDSLKGFHRYRKISSDHYIRVSYNPGCNEFGFCEFIDGRPNLCGAIVFHGWEEIGYKENYSIQFKPSYGWSKHT